MNPGMTLILGGTGKTGRRIAKRLMTRGLPVRIGSRSGDPPFYWEDESTWAPAVRGVEAAYVAYYPDITFPGALEHVRSFARVAFENGVRHLVLLSGRGEAAALLGEEAIRESGAEWTIVRSSFMNQNFDEGFWVDSVFSGELAAPAGVIAEPFIDADDIADVAVAALTGEAPSRQVYEVSGPRLLTFADAVDEIGEAVGREILYVPVSSEEFRSGMVAAGIHEDLATNLTAVFAEVLDGRNEYVSDGVQRALGRQAKDFKDYAREAAATGVWDGDDGSPQAEAR
jgi:uncharacterized protein YbjT (DUF2867 family)